MPTKFILSALLIVSLSLSGCGLFRSATEETGSLFARMMDNGTSRQSSLDRLEEENQEYLLDSVFRPAKGKARKGPSQNEEKAKSLMAEAESLYRQGIQQMNSGEKSASLSAKTLTRAAGKYEKAASFWTNSTLEQDALYKAGEAYFFADHYFKSNDVFERLVKFYEGTRYADAVHARRFAIAQYWLGLSRENPQSPLVLNLTDPQRPLKDSSGNAIRILNRIRLDHPTGKIADDATLALANAYFEKEQWMDAADTYEDLRVNFPNSEHQFNAHLFELKSRLQAYQGPHYDGTHLDTADKLSKALTSQFPKQANEHKEMLTREMARIRKMKAEREMALASYYEARGAYNAAGLHYRQVQSDYQNTPVADQANQRLAKISDKPARSNEPPEWVANLFPDPKPAEPLLGTSLKAQIR